MRSIAPPTIPLMRLFASMLLLLTPLACDDNGVDDERRELAIECDECDEFDEFDEFDDEEFDSVDHPPPDIPEDEPLVVTPERVIAPVMAELQFEDDKPEEGGEPLPGSDPHESAVPPTGTIPATSKPVIDDFYPPEGSSPSSSRTSSSSMLAISQRPPRSSSLSAAPW